MSKVISSNRVVSLFEFLDRNSFCFIGSFDVLGRFVFDTAANGTAPLQILGCISSAPGSSIKLLVDLNKLDRTKKSQEVVVAELYDSQACVGSNMASFQVESVSDSCLSVQTDSIAPTYAQDRLSVMFDLHDVCASEGRMLSSNPMHLIFMVCVVLVVVEWLVVYH